MTVTPERLAEIGAKLASDDPSGDEPTVTSDWLRQAARDLLALVTAAPETASFQDRVIPWMQACFGPAISADMIERNDRFLEEAVELVQACGGDRFDAHQMVDYVFDRPVGEKAQEAGGVMITFAALCLAHGIDMHQAGDAELARAWDKIDAIRAKQAAKPRGADLAPWKPTHRHYKGGLYRVLFEAIHSETEEPMTIYQTPDGRAWARPAAMFHEKLPDGRLRFAPIEG
jgi:hypothetical protein